MGDGSLLPDGTLSPFTAYDANGNIKKMQQWGLKIGSSAQIDNLNYQYSSGSNKLLAVTEQTLGNTDNKLGDFTDKNLTGDDYSYDVNGNLILDKNKNISSITYNHLNLPAVITVTGKGTISYTYDAAGNKLKKVTVENNASVPFNNTNYTSNITSTTNYISGFVYETKAYSNASLSTLQYSDKLQFTGHEEGRIRPLAASFAYDYMLKDHLGNVRMLLTDELKQDEYPVASLEASKIATEKLYYDIQDGNVVDTSASTGITDYVNDNGIGNNPPDATFSAANSAKLYKLNSSTAKTGLGITLKVMAGDRIDVFGKSYYFQNTSGTGGNSPLPVIDLLNAFLGGPAAVGSAHGVTGTAINNTINLPGINSMITQQNTQSNASPTKPRAFINVVFFDEQFKSYEAGFSISMVGSNSVVKDHYSELQNLIATKSGYVYIYCSNESPVNVFFDNLQVTHTRSPILEETHYYPFGLVQQGISSKAAGTLTNKNQYNGKEKQSNEFSDGSGLELNDFGFRMQDPQIGRWFTIDPLADKYHSYSPYNYCVNNPMNVMDPFGLDVEEIAGGWRFTGEDAKSAFSLLTNKKKNAFIDVRGGEKNREKANYKKDPDYYKKWAVFSVGSLKDGIGMLSSFANSSLDNVAINTHGSSSEAMFENKPKGENDDDDQVTASEMTNYNTDKSKNNAATNDLIGDVAKIGDKIKKGGNIIFIACFAGQGAEGKQMLSGLNTLFGNKANVFLPTDYSRVELYKTSKVLALDNLHLSQNSNTRWITGNGNNSYRDIIINRADHLPAVQLVK